MKSNNKHIDKKIKKKIEEYEFDFSDHAWDKMESLMDPTASADDAAPPTRSNFNIFKILLIMLLLFIVLYFGMQTISDQDQNPKITSLPTSELPQTTESTIPNQTINLPVNNEDENILKPGKVFQQNSNKAITNKKNKNVQKKARPQLSPAINYSVLSRSISPLLDATQLKTKIELPKIAPYDWSNINTQNPPIDSALLKRLSQQLNDYQNHFQPEKVYLQFDRTFFKPGESIWFSAYVRDANTLKASAKSDLIYIELNAPNGGNLKTLTLVAENGRVRGDFQLNENMPGGLYTIKAYTNWQKNQNHFFEREIQVQAAVLPKLRMELNMLRKAYGPGDEVEAKLELKNLENNVLANQAFNYNVILDGKVQEKHQGTTDSNGKAKLKFELPKILETTEGLVNISIEHKGQMESIARSIPIVLNKIDLQFLPEGGDLVETLSGKVAFKAINEFGKPADVEGHVMNDKGQQVATFKSYHQGMGAFEFQPKEGEYYYARITNPIGIETDYAFPKVMQRGYTLKVGKQENNALHFEVRSTEAEALFVVLQSNGQIYESRTTVARKGIHHLKIPVDNLPIGIAQLTLFDSKEVPRAERLVFLNPDKKLDISITTDKDKYKPREKVRMTVEVKDERGLPMPGQFSLAVADDNLLTFADDKQGHILSYLLIESELNGTIEEPNFYFDLAEKHPEKDQLLALDYLMLTQGWRRFNWMDMQQAPTLVMDYKGERAVLAGVVMDKQKNPVAGARVEIVEARNRVVYSDQNGKFAFENVKRNANNRIEVLVEKNSIYRNFSTSNYGDDLEVFIDGPFVYNFKNLPNDRDFVRGQIIDASGETLIGANVLVKGTNIGTVTDIEGKFSFKPGLNTPYDLVVSYTGYETKNITVNNPSEPIGLQLDEGMILNEVVVTGMGTRRQSRRDRRQAKRTKKRKKEASSGPVITSKQIAKLPTRNISALASNTAGLTQADEGDVISIRGARSRDTNYYLDGIRISSSQLIPNTSTKYMTGGTPAQFENSDAMIADQFEKETNEKLVLRNARKRKTKRKKAKIVDRKIVISLEKGAEKFQSGFYQSRDFYMPVYTANEKVEIRNDFRSTIYWNPTIEVGRDGMATVEFFTNDEFTTFRATVEGLAIDGGIGNQKHTFYSQLPFGMDAKIPERILSGDVIQLPLTLTNNTSETIRGKLEIEIPDALIWENQPNEKQKLAAKESKTIYLKLKAKNATESIGNFNIQFLANNYEDGFTKSIKIIPRGFPVEKMFSGREKEREFLVDLNDPIEGSVSAVLNCYPSLAKDLSAGMERMLRQPSGCFEQTSSSNYPNVLVYDLLKSTNNLDEATAERTQKFLDFGYKRLTGFEVPGGGFDWYGRPPGHEALTAYGLLQFTDMSQVYPVSNQMLKRNINWLLSRKDGKGGWLNSKRALHRWAGTNAIADAFIVWALTEAGEDRNLDREVEKSYKDAMESKDPYLLALMANTMFERGDKRAKNIMDILLPQQLENGSWNGLTTSMTHSRGKGLLIETTSLTALAILKDKVGMSQLQKAIDFISSSKSPYGFGSTQSTVLAMKALVQYAKFVQNEIKGGHVLVYVNGKEVAKQKYKKGRRDNIRIPGLGNYLSSGQNKVSVKFTKEEKGFPYDLTLKYNTRQPNSAKECSVDLKTELMAQKISVGENIRLTTTITNMEERAIPNTIAKVGIPAGLSLQAWQLKELQEKGVFDFYEIFDGYVVFHYRGLEAGEQKVIGLDLKADIPGKYEAPASVAYLYYTNELQKWTKPGEVVIGQ